MSRKSPPDLTPYTTFAYISCGVTQPRLNDLLRGRLSRFSLDALVNIAAALGCRVHVGLDAA
jgi:predicted XRE-type DNA-binding protein